MSSQHIAQPVIEQMVTQQVRAWNVLDNRVLDALRAIPREPFVPPTLRASAYADANLAIGVNQMLLAPTFEGRILQALAIQGTEQAVVLGAANAHLAACLAKLVSKVLLVDRDAALLETARQTMLAASAQNNIAVQAADPLTFASPKTFDLIAVSGSVPTLPDTLRQALTVGGRLFVVVGNAPTMQAVLINRTGEHSWEETVLFETCLPTLAGVARPDTFSF